MQKREFTPMQGGSCRRLRLRQCRDKACLVRGEQELWYFYVSIVTIRIVKQLCVNSPSKIEGNKGGVWQWLKLYLFGWISNKISYSPSPLFQHQWAAPHQCQNKFCRWLRLAPLVYLRGGVYRLILRGFDIHNHFRNLGNNKNWSNRNIELVAP